MDELSDGAFCIPEYNDKRVVEVGKATACADSSCSTTVVSGSELLVDETTTTCSGCDAVGCLAATATEDTTTATDKRGVHFHELSIAVVYEIDGLTQEEVALAWYTQDDYDIIKARNSLAVKLKKADCFEENDENTFRGLEHRTKPGYSRRRQNKRVAMEAVLDEQDRQREENDWNIEEMRIVYEEASERAVQDAIQLGQKDVGIHETIEEANTEPCFVLPPVPLTSLRRAVSDESSVASEFTLGSMDSVKRMFRGGQRRRDSTSTDGSRRDSISSTSSKESISSNQSTGKQLRSSLRRKIFRMG